MPLELSLQLAAPIFAQSPISLQRNLDERMNQNEWFQQPTLSGVTVELLNQNLWKQFYEQHTEMIITKSGRRMFPSMQINVSGLQKRESYYVLLEIVPVSDRRHKYSGFENGNKNSNMGCWSIAGPAEPQHPFNRRIYKHPDSPAMGSHWMDNSINFNKLKLTNNINDNINMVLTSMHKYVPHIWIIRCSNAKNYDELFSYPTKSIVFRETEFIAVTAYQNENITKLKIDNNPFAKGFRETGQSRFKRRHHRAKSSDPNRDEEVSVSFFDSESNQVSSESSVASTSVSSTQGSTENLAIENSTDNDARDDARPIAVNPLVSSPANPRLPVVPENNHEATFHRPWLDSPCRQVMPSSRNSSYQHHRSSVLHPCYMRSALHPYMYSPYAIVASQNYMRYRDCMHLRNFYYRPL